MSTCAACERDCRVTRIALVVSPNRKAKRGRVCQSCARLGVLVVPTAIAPKLVRQEVRSDELKTAVKRLRAWITVAKQPIPFRAESNAIPDAARIEAYESVLEMLRAVGEGR